LGPNTNLTKSIEHLHFVNTNKELI
ncbi:uncharacterized protein METZ01_LOCUS108404, partial [marine metagenome]